MALASMMCALNQQSAHALTGLELWNQYKTAPENHANVPNCSYAGYRQGAALPAPAVVANVKTHGAVGNGTTDDTAAFNAAITAAANAGGGAVLVPAGRYALNGFLNLNRNGVVLRGEGQGKTILDFKNHLTTLKGTFQNSGGSSAWSWAGGLIWIGPSDTFSSNGTVNWPDRAIEQQWEYWKPGSTIASVTTSATRGATSITLNTTAGLSAGQLVMMSWSLSDTTNYSFQKHVAGHSLMDGYNWAAATWIIPPAYPRFQWPVEIASVSGNTITLKQPLRVDIRSEWAVQIQSIGTHVRDVGVERMTLKLHAPMTHTHLANIGWNGIYVNRAYNCWVDDVAVESAENPIILAAAKNVTVNNINLTGPESHHHSLACRVNSHDNLFQNFTVNACYGSAAKVKHGINVEWFSSGNVWSKGTMNKGTFDSHRALSFDNIRTEITTSNSSDGPGGATQAGPFLGRRAVNWNALISPVGSLGAKYIFQPECHSMGALVGIRGAAQDNAVCPAMVAGNKGTLIADAGVVPNPANLYEAEYNLRVGGANNQWPTVSISSPANGATFGEPTNITINATANDADGTISKVEFYSGTYMIGSDASSPFSVVWTSVNAGSYALRARAFDNTQTRVTSAPVNITVSKGTATTIEDTDSRLSYFGTWETFSYTSASGGTMHRVRGAAAVGSGFQVSFSGTRVEFYGAQLSYTGGWDIYLDNMTTPIARVPDRWGPDTYQDLIWSSGAIPNGNHTLKAVCTGSGDWAFVDFVRTYNSGSSTPPSNVAPSVSLTSPSNGATYTAPANITINANASDSNGTVSKVEFFRGTTAIATDTTSPYSITWSSVAAGAYSLTARATDNGGAVTTSGTVNVTVNGTTGGGTVLYRINAGGAAVSPFSADANFSGGTAASTTATIDLSGATSPAPAAVYQTERYGNVTYTFGSLTASSSHTVRLHFAETWHNGAGSRKFDVSINGTQVLNDYDVFAAAGAKNKAVITQHTTTANASGQIVIQFTTVVDNAKISGIEIIKN